MANQKNSVFRKLIGMFLLIEGIVLVGMGLLIFHFARIQEEADQFGREEMAAQTIEQINEQIETVYNLADSLTNDSRLSRIAYHMYPDEYERSQIILGLLSSLRSTYELNASIREVQVAFPTEGISLSSTGEYDNDFVFEQQDNHLLAGFLLHEDGQLKVRISYPLISDMIGNVPDYDCKVSFSDQYFQSVLTAFGEGDNQGALLIFTNQYNKHIPLAVSESGEVGGSLLETIDTIEMDKRHSNIHIEDSEYALLVNSSERYPITLIAWRNVDKLSENIIFTLICLSVLILITGALFVLIIVQANRHVARPIYQLMDAFDQVGKGRLSTRIHHEHHDEFAFIYDSFNSMTVQTEKLIEDIKEQHSLLQNAELMQLQAQIDPHFLYNSFNAIKYMANGEEYDQITEFVSALAQYYRFINKEVRQTIPLSSEVQHMETYLYIQQMRFEERIHVQVTGLPENADTILVPKLVLQPLVENCYNHGLKNKLGEGIISVEFSQVGRQLYIAVADNGDGMNQENLAELQKQITATDDRSVSHALANIRRRLELAYGERDMLTLSISTLGGLCVTLRFDLDKTSTNLK